MFVTGHVLKISDCGFLAVIRFKDHIGGYNRSYRSGDPDQAIWNGSRGMSQSSSCSTSEIDEIKNTYVAVNVSAYKVICPTWFVTEDQLMTQYQRLQRDEKVDIHHELLPIAKRIWSEQVKQKVDASKALDDLRKPRVMCQSSAAEDHEGTPLK